MTEKKPYIIWLDNSDINNIIYHLFLFENEDEHFYEFNKIPEGIIRERHRKIANDFNNLIQCIDFTESVFTEEVKLDNENDVISKLLRSKYQKCSLQINKPVEEIRLSEFIFWMENNH